MQLFGRCNFQLHITLFCLCGLISGKNILCWFYVAPFHCISEKGQQGSVDQMVANAWQELVAEMDCLNISFHKHQRSILHWGRHFS